MRDIPVGSTFNRWTVLNGPTVRKGKTKYWPCRCSCGTSRHVRPDRLFSGESKSCGCLHREIVAENTGNTTHGLSRLREYKAWQQAKQRCFNPGHPMFAHYGGRGITMCEDWRDDFEAFFECVGEKPDPSYSIGRIDNDGNYEPGNVEWQTASEQARNKRPGMKRQVSNPQKAPPKEPKKKRAQKGKWIWRGKERSL